MAGNIIIPLLTGFDGKGVREAETALTSLGNRLKSFGKTAAVSLGSALAGAGAVNFVKSSVDAAAQLEQNMSGVKTIFGDLTPQIQGFIDSGTSMGMSMADTAKAVTFLGSVFKQTGMPMDEVIGKTKTMVSLASDLAATYGYSVQEALTAMTATFRGEYDPIEKFGVAMKQQQVNAVLAEQGLKGLTGAALIAAQQQVRYNLILERTGDAQGAFARQSGNLLVQQAVLKATFTDMQAKLGGALVPILAKFAVTLQPLIAQALPHLAKVFDAIGQAIIALMPLLPQFMDMLTTAFDVMSTVISATTPTLIALMTVIVNNMPMVTGLIAALVGIYKVKPIIEAVRVQFRLFQMEMRYATIAATYLDEVAMAVRGVNTEIKSATAAQVLFNKAVKANPYIIAAIAIGLAIGAVVQGYNALNKQAEKVKKEIETLPIEAIKEANRAAKKAAEDASKLAPGMADPGLAAKTAWQAAIDKYNEYQKLMLGQGTGRSAWQRWGADTPKKYLGITDGSNTASTGAAVKTWFDTLTDEVKKQSKRLRLEKLGASAALVDSILGATDWNTVADKLIQGGKKAIDKFQAEFNKTAAGISAAQAAADAAAKDLADRQAKYVEAVTKRIETLGMLASASAEMMPKTYAEVTAQLGQFESDVVSATASLKEKLKSALDSKDISSDAYASLSAYVDKEVVALRKLSAARDEVVRRLEAAKGVYTEVASAVRGYANVTTQTTAQVTESYTKLIDGVEVTVTRTVDALQSNDIVGAYKKIVDKTKAFYQNLVNLKKMGLNATLFKQIIDAGVDAGAVTADAIVNGGQETVTSLNDLFGQLDATGAQMGDLTAQVMENSGIKIVSSFIDGLTSQEADLADKAKSLAQTFSDAFNNAVKLAVPQVDYTKFGLTAAQAAAALKNAGLPADQGGTGANPTIDFSSWISMPSDLQAQWTPTNVPSNFDMVTGWKPVNTTAFSAWDSMSPEMQSKYSPVATPITTPTYNVTVNAGIGTDGASVGQSVVQVLKEYERNNGAVWVSA